MYHFKYGRFRFDKVIIFSLYMTFFENVCLIGCGSREGMTPGLPCKWH